MNVLKQIFQIFVLTQKVNETKGGKRLDIVILIKKKQCIVLVKKHVNLVVPYRGRKMKASKLSFLSSEKNKLFNYVEKTSFYCTGRKKKMRMAHNPS